MSGRVGFAVAMLFWRRGGRVWSSLRGFTLAQPPPSMSRRSALAISRTQETGVKKFLLLIAFFSTHASGGVFPGSCEVPEFLTEGKTYVFKINLMEEYHSEVIKIDRDACWIKIKNNNGREIWVNLNVLPGIYE
jgi:hypothetical protein